MDGVDMSALAGKKTLTKDEAEKVGARVCGCVCVCVRECA